MDIRWNEVLKRAISLILATLLVFSLCGCGKNQEESNGKGEYEKIKNSDEISIFSYKPDTLCPILSKNEANIRMLGVVFDSLISLPNNLYPEPCLAESWSVSEDGRKWTIALRQNATWHDGGAFDAEDVIYTISSIKENPESIYSYNVSNIKSVKSNGGFELEIEVVEPWANFVNLLYFPIIKKTSEKVDPNNFEPVGTGAYKFGDTDEGNVFRLVKNKDWWGEQPETDHITVKLLPDNGTALYAFSSGSIDMVVADDMNWGRFVDPVSSSYTYVPTPIFHFIGINHDNETLNFQEIRKAISLFVDRGKLIEEVMTGYGTATTMPLHPNWFMCEKMEFNTKQNMNEAKEILEENDWELKSGAYEKVVDDKTLRTEFKILCNKDNERGKNVAKLIVASFEKLGIMVGVEELSFEDYQTRISEGDYDLFIGSYVVPPSAEFSFILGEDNFFRFKNDEMNHVVNKLKTKYSISGIEEGYGEVFEKFEELNPVIGLFFEDQVMVHSNRIKGDIVPSYFDTYRGIERLQKEDVK